MDHGESSYRRFLAGDPEALPELVHTYRPGLEQYLFSIVHDRALAEDLTEDTFVKLCLKRPRPNGTASFKTWLYAIGRNLALDHLRRTKRRNETGGEIAETLADPAGDPAAAFLADEEKRALFAAMERLHPPYRQILWLTYFEDFSPAECAKILRKNQKNVSVLLHRAKAALKKELEKEDMIP